MLDNMKFKIIVIILLIVVVCAVLFFFYAYNEQQKNLKIQEETLIKENEQEINKKEIPFISKPYDMQGLAEKIAEVLKSKG